MTGTVCNSKLTMGPTFSSVTSGCMCGRKDFLSCKGNTHHLVIIIQYQVVNVIYGKTPAMILTQKQVINQNMQQIANEIVVSHYNKSQSITN